MNFTEWAERRKQKRSPADDGCGYGDRGGECHGFGNADDTRKETVSMKRFGIMYLTVLNGLRCLETHHESIALAEREACKIAVEHKWLWFRVHEIP